jgi:hypothetical protein
MDVAGLNRKGGFMAKLYVALAGLFGVVPATDKEDASVLFRRAEGEEIEGAPIPRHVMRVRFRQGGEDSLTTRLVKQQGIGFAPLSMKPLEIQDRDLFFGFKDFAADNCGVTVRTGCTGKNPGATCKIGEKPLLSAWLPLCGGSIRPIEIRGKVNDMRVTAISGQLLGLRVPGNMADVKSFEKARPIANAALFEASLIGNAAFLTLGEQQLQLDPASQEDLARIGIAAQAEPAFIVWVENLPEEDGPHVHPGGDNVDSHFVLFYDLLDSPQPLKKLVPSLSFGNEHGGHEMEPSGHDHTGTTVPDNKPLDPRPYVHPNLLSMDIRVTEAHLRYGTNGGDGVAPGSQCIPPLFG